MKYHAPTKQFVIDREDIDIAAICLKQAIADIRKMAGLPLTKHERTGPLSQADLAQKVILDAADAIGIDMGARWGNEIDVSGI